jgi:hypothetical protein
MLVTKALYIMVFFGFLLFVSVRAGVPGSSSVRNGQRPREPCSNPHRLGESPASLAFRTACLAHTVTRGACGGASVGAQRTATLAAATPRPAHQPAGAVL